MTISFKTNELCEYAPLPPVLFALEASGDQIVPDTMPDVERILRADCGLQGVSISPAEGRVSVSAVGDVCVLYRDPEGGVQSLRLQIPLRQEGVMKEADEGFYRLCVRRVECTAPNPRKISVRIVGRLMGECFGKVRMCIPEETEEPGVEIRKREIGVNVPAGILTLRMEQTEELPLPENAPAMDAVIGMTLSCTELSCKAVPGKAVIKGNLVISGEYLSGETVARARWELPFTRIAEQEGITEESTFLLSFGEESVFARPGEGSEGRSAEVSVAGNIRLLQTKQQNICYIADAYSTKTGLTPELRSAELWSVEKEFCLSTDISQRGETEMTEVTDISGQVTGICQSEGKLTGEAVVNLSGRREDRQCCLCRRISFEIPTEKHMVLPEAELRGLTCKVENGFAEIRGEISVKGPELCSVPLAYVAAAEGGEPLPAGEGVTLSLCRIGKGEDCFLWGKALRAPMQGIREANGITEEIAAEDRVLIIPRR